MLALFFSYQNRFRPTYKIAFKTVTELEWRCCPGYHGLDCKDIKPPQQPQPHQGPNPGHTTRHAQSKTRTAAQTALFSVSRAKDKRSLSAGPERRETGHHETRRGETDKVRLLEGEVERLSQTVQTLQSALKDLTENLRTDLQEDTRKTLVTLLNNMRPPDSASTAGMDDSPAVLDGQATKGGALGDKALEKIMVRLDAISSDLKYKDDALEDLRGTMSSHEGQIRVLMDASQTPAIADFEVIQVHINKNFERMKKELDQNVEEHMAKLQSTCDDRIGTLQKTCEDSRDRGLDSLTKLVDTKEADLRKEMREIRREMAAADTPIRTQRQTDPAKPEEAHSSHKDLWREIERIAEAHRVLNIRIDNELAHLSEPVENNEITLLIEDLEARVNISEQNAEMHCFYIEQKLSRTVTDEAAVLRQLLDERLNDVKDQFTNMLVEMSNSSFPGMFSIDALQAEVNSNKFQLQGLDDRVSVVAELCSAGCSASEIPEGSSPTVRGLENILKDVSRNRNDFEVLYKDVNANADKLRRLEDLVGRQSVAGNRRDSAMVEDLRRRLDSFGARLSSDVSQCKQNAQGVSDDVSAVDGRVSRLEKVCGRLDAVSANIKELKDGLERHVGGLREAVHKVNVSCGNHAADIAALRTSLQKMEEDPPKHGPKGTAAKDLGEFPQQRVVTPGVHKH